MVHHTRTSPFARALARTFALLSTLTLAGSLTCCALLEDTLSPTSTSEVEVPQPSGPYYDGWAFSKSGGRYRYDDGTTTITRTGIDVSDHQGDIDWSAVVSDGIEFAFLRVGYRGNTEGGLYPDERFQANLQGAREVGIACGAYFYSQAVSVEEAEQEAAFVLELLAGTPLDYPVAFDYEILPATRIADIDTQTASQIAEAFCSAIRAGGYEPMVYGNTFDLARLNPQLLDGCAVWCAEYDDGPSYEHKADIWQYTNQGYVAGVSGLCDLNLDLSAVP